MSDIAIRVENLSKQYKIGTTRYRHDSIRNHLTDWAKSLFVRNGHSSSISGQRSVDRDPSLVGDPSSTIVGPRSSVDGSPDTFWALKDVSFEINHGETVGFIGRNGAGKSTLLKILSRITQPTKGYAEIHGRVGSLLEVGTGFHPELTGRENIYLNGTILGMKRTEIVRKFDEIVDFSGVERFLDTPVKRYSSGMYVRLAFAVAAHLETEILIVDEVLAVGDAEFQKKCLDKMQTVGKQGRTVLFVSHTMSAVTRLCGRALMLSHGGVLKDGPSHEVVNAYLNSGACIAAVREWPDLKTAPGTEVVRLRAMRLRTEDGQIADKVDIRQSIGLEMEYEVLKDGYVVVPHFSVHNEEGIEIFSVIDTAPDWKGRRRPGGRYVSTAWIPGNFLADGTLVVGPAVSTLYPYIMHFHVSDAVACHVIDNFDGDSARGDFPAVVNGVVRPLLKWSTQASPNI